MTKLMISSLSSVPLYPVGGHTHCVCKQLANAPPKTFLTNGFIIKSPNHPIPPPSPQVAIHSTKIVYSDPDLTTENMTRLGNTPHNQTALDRISLDSEWRWHEKTKKLKICFFLWWTKGGVAIRWKKKSISPHWNLPPGNDDYNSPITTLQFINNNRSSILSSFTSRHAETLMWGLKEANVGTSVPLPNFSFLLVVQSGLSFRIRKGHPAKVRRIINKCPRTVQRCFDKKASILKPWALGTSPIKPSDYTKM